MIIPWEVAGGLEKPWGGGVFPGNTFLHNDTIRRDKHEKHEKIVYGILGSLFNVHFVKPLYLSSCQPDCTNHKEGGNVSIGYGCTTSSRRHFKSADKKQE
jgi:hypothetical protein